MKGPPIGQDEDLAAWLNRQTKEQLRQFIGELLQGSHGDDNAQLVTALIFYEGSTGLLRQLYQKLTRTHRDTIAIAFWERLQSLPASSVAAGKTLDEETVAILQLADPFLLYSSVETNVIFLLRELARQSQANRAPLESVVQIHLAALNMRENFDWEYWNELSHAYGEGVFGLVLSGLSELDSVDDVFEWLNATASSQRLTDLLKASLPALYERAPNEVQRHLGKLVSPQGRWTSDAKSQIQAYCKNRNIRIASPIAASPDLEPEGIATAAPAEPVHSAAALGQDDRGRIELNESMRAFRNAVCRTDNPLPDRYLSRPVSAASEKKAKELAEGLHAEMLLLWVK